MDTLKRCLWISFFLCILLLTGCEKKNSEKEQKIEVEYTVVENSVVPKKLQELIEEKKESPFRMSYKNQQYMYIVVGYGKQNVINRCSLP